MQEARPSPHRTHWCTIVRSPLSFKMQAHIFYVLYSVEDCKKLAAHAEAHGADGIACMAPVFFKPGTVEALVDFLAQVRPLLSLT